MLVQMSSSALKDGRWYEYVVRFVLGGVATVFTGVVAKVPVPRWAGFSWHYRRSFAPAPRLSKGTKFAESARTGWTAPWRTGPRRRLRCGLRWSWDARIRDYLYVHGRAQRRVGFRVRLGRLARRLSHCLAGRP